MKVYELTTNVKDGFAKWYVRGIESDEQAKLIALRGFGSKYVSTLITYYDDFPSKSGTDWLRKSYSIQGFIKKAKSIYQKKGDNNG